LCSRIYGAGTDFGYVKMGSGCPKCFLNGPGSYLNSSVHFLFQCARYQGIRDALAESQLMRGLDDCFAKNDLMTLWNRPAVLEEFINRTLFSHDTESPECVVIEESLMEDNAQTGEQQ
jgi:hypothetical protein